MKRFLNWNMIIVTGSALAGATYGAMATIAVADTGISLWEVVFASVCASALCAAAGSALYRICDGWLQLCNDHRRLSRSSSHFRKFHLSVRGLQIVS